METIAYQVESCIEQGKRIKAEYPNIKEVSFELTELNYFKLREFTDATGRNITLSHQSTRGSVCVIKDETTIYLKTAKLIVESVIVMEE